MAAPIQPNAYQPDENLKKQRDQFFQNKRNESIQGANAQAQAGDDAIQRRFASMGASGSGAQIAALQKNRDAGMDAQRKAQADVGAMELQAGESDFGRSFQANEANAARQFQANEANTARQFQGSMSDKDIAFKQKLADTEQGNKLQEIDLAKQQFALDKDTTEFNKRMAEIEAGATPGKGMFGQLTSNLEDAGKTILGGAVGSAIGGAVLGPVGNIGGAIAGITGGGGPKCFLTTACVEVMGMKDDCWVLETARYFRDSYMVSDPQKASEMVEYYTYAPTIVEKINLRDDSEKVWKSLFWRHLIPFVLAVKVLNQEAAHSLYLRLISKAKELANTEA